MKRSILTVATALLLAATPLASQSAGIPTYSAATDAQLMLQYQQMLKDYETLKNQYAAVTGSYGRGGAGLTGAIAQSSVVPGSWQEVVAMQQKGVFAGKQAYYEKLISTIPAEVFQDASKAAGYKMSTDSVRAAMAGGEALYDTAQTHLKNFQTLAAMVDTTQNVKDAADLQNRMTAELGMAQAAQTKLQALNANLNANLLNQANQDSAAREKFFGRKP